MMVFFLQTMGEYEEVKVRRTSAPLPSRDTGCPCPPPVFVRRPLPEYFRTKEDNNRRKKLVDDDR